MSVDKNMSVDDKAAKAYLEGVREFAESVMIPSKRTADEELDPETPKCRSSRKAATHMSSRSYALPNGGLVQRGGAFLCEAEYVAEEQ
jgi:hypothetical protein